LYGRAPVSVATYSTLSDQLIVTTAVLYLVALVGFAVEVATWSRGLVRTGQASPVLVSVEAAGSSKAGTESQDTRELRGPDPGARAVGAGHSRIARGAGRAAMFLTTAGWVLHVASVTTRGLAAGRVPWGNMYEFSSAICLSAVTVFLALQWRGPSRRLGVFVMLPVLLGLGLATTVLYTPAGPLVPALHSYWLAIHVTAAITASGLFTIASVLAAVQLAISGRRQRRVVRALRAVVPEAEELDELCFRLLAIAFPIWTFAVVAGAIWAEGAWGRYWGWDPKETWAFITWVAYAAYLHARVTAGWRGRRAAVLALVGAAAFTFNYFGVNMWIVGLHSYAGTG
jgi:cytochrome c-type biogenesis protein CcsB